MCAVDLDRLQKALDAWQRQNTAEVTKKLHNWCKTYCKQDAPKPPDDEPEDKSHSEEAET